MSLKQFKDIRQVYGGAEGPLGFPMSDAQARALEKALAKVPADCKSFVEQHAEPGIGVCRKRVAPIEHEIKVDRRQDVSLITTDAGDLDDEALFPEGGEWKYFERNGAHVTWCHKYDRLPLGNSPWRKLLTAVEIYERKGDAWLACTDYHPRPDWWPESKLFFGDAVWHWVRYFNLRGKSIGFVPLTMRKPTKADIAKRPWLDGLSWVFPTWLALEYAVAPIQANPEATVVTVSQAKALGVPTPPELLAALGIEAEAETEKRPEPPPPTKTEGVRRVEVSSAQVVTLAEAREVFERGLAEMLGEIPATIEDTLARMRGRV